MISVKEARDMTTQAITTDKKYEIFLETLNDSIEQAARRGRYWDTLFIPYEFLDRVKLIMPGYTFTDTPAEQQCKVDWSVTNEPATNQYNWKDYDGVSCPSCCNHGNVLLSWISWVCGNCGEKVILDGTMSTVRLKLWRYPNFGPSLADFKRAIAAKSLESSDMDQEFAALELRMLSEGEGQ